MKSKLLIFVLFGMFLFGFASIASSLPTAQSIWDPTNVYWGQTSDLYCNGTSDTGSLSYEYKIYNDSGVVVYEGISFKEGSISVGYTHTCGIRDSDGRVLCWGNNGNGQLGIGNTTTMYTPTLTTDSSAYSKVSTYYFHTCGIRESDGRVLCWGYNGYGQLGNGNTTYMYTPTLTTDTSAYSELSVGQYHTCGIRESDGRVLCWGFGSSGQLGVNNQSNVYTPVLTTDTSAYSSVDAGAGYTLGIRNSTGQVTSWGENSGGQLGRGSTSFVYLTPGAIDDTSPYDYISGGYLHSCGIRSSDNRVLCWGYNAFGQLGNGSTGGSTTDIILTTDTSSYSSVDAGKYYSCGIRESDGRVLCWGYNANGQLGIGNTTYMYTPTLTTDTSAYSELSINELHSCGIRSSDGRVLCWGYNGNGQLGNGNTTQMNTPTLTTDSSSYFNLDIFSSGMAYLVQSLTGFIMGDSWTLSCRSKDSNGYSSWTNSSKTVLNPLVSTADIDPESAKAGDDLNFSCTSTDYRSGSEPSFEYNIYWNQTYYFGEDYFREGSISTGNYHTCGIRESDGRVLCWGYNAYGQLGIGNTTNMYAPTLTTDSSAYSKISSFGGSSCGIRSSDNRVLCWGDNGVGQLGIGNTTNMYAPVLTTDSSAYSDLYVGNGHACGIRSSDGRVLCWGDNGVGQLGIGNTTNMHAPTLTTDTSAYSQVSAGSTFSCGIRSSDGRVLCWGYNAYGQLGIGNTTQMNTPTLTTDSSAYSQVSAGSWTNCGIRSSDGRVLCWGYNYYGQVGDGSTTTRTSPTLTTDSSAYSEINGKFYANCGIRSSDGKSLCWGDNFYGQLGIGSTDSSAHSNPSEIQGGNYFSELSLGQAHACGIRSSDGRVLCWGSNYYGALGLGNLSTYYVPTLTADTSGYEGEFFTDGSKQYVYDLLSGNTTQGDNFTMSCRATNGIISSNWNNYSMTILGCPDVTSGGIKAFILENATTECLRVDEEGDVRVIGDAYFDQGALVPPSDAFILQDSVGNSLFYVDNMCNLYTSGSYSTGQTITYGGTDSLYVMRDSDSAFVFKVDSSGNIYAKGDFGWDCGTMSGD